ncbi:hypothetical protein HC928_02735 [bacterium]|nr:hypothetical protein [bacterium]
MSSSDKYSYNRFGSKGQRVGQAVVDILSKEQPQYTVEDILEAYSHKYIAELEDCIEKNLKRYESPFYVFVLTKKEMWAENVVRNYFVARQSKPDMQDMIVEYPHATKTLYEIDSKKCSINLEWTLPGVEEAKSIMKNPSIYDPFLVDCIKKGFNSPSP